MGSRSFPFHSHFTFLHIRDLHNYEIFAPSSSRETTDRCEGRTRWTLLIVQPALLMYATTSQRDAKSYFKTSSKSKYIFDRLDR